MLVAGSRWLPQYKKSIAASRRRLARGPRIKTHATLGAARVKTRSLVELKRLNPRAGH